MACVALTCHAENDGNIIDNIKYEECRLFTETKVVRYTGGCQAVIDRLEIPDSVLLPVESYPDRSKLKCEVSGMIPGALNHCMIKELILPGGFSSITKDMLPPRGYIESLILKPGITALEDSALYDRGLTHITLPEGLLYIGRDALSLNSFNEIEIPSTVKRINKRAFVRTTDIGKIRCHATEPPEVTIKTFGFQYPDVPGMEIDCITEIDVYNCILEVPENSIGKYRQAPGWKEFRNIIAIPENEPASINGVSPDIPKGFSTDMTNGQLVIFPCGKRHITVVNAKGEMVYSHEICSEVKLRLPAGIYIISDSEMSQKVAVR